LTRKKLERIINQLYAIQEIDLVEAPDWTGITSFIQPKKCPIVIRLNGSDAYFCHLEHRPVKWKNQFHEKRALQKADGLISVSQFTADVTNEVFGLKKEFTIIPNAIDTTLFKKTDSAEKILPLGGKGVLYFGSLIRKKGLLELPFIFNEVNQKNSEAQLILIGRDVPDILTGNPSTWAMMQPLFTPTARQKVSYLGSVSYQEIKTHIKEANLCVFPSFAEALPVSWIEAMALQKAVVASSIGWAKEVIVEGTEGFLVHPKDHKQYAERILELLESPELQQRFGMAARKKIVEQFTIKVVAQQSVSFYKKVIQLK